MLLVHKQHMHQMHSIPLSHRRNPSAPPQLSVLPTRTPGLLSLTRPQQRDAKPPKVQLSKSPKPPRAHQHHPTRQADDERDKPTSVSDPIESSPAPASPALNQDANAKRGRNRSAEKELSKKQQRRSASQQPPPAAQPSQAEAPTSDTEVPSKSSRKRPQQQQQQQRISTAPSTPFTTLGQPSGRLAKNRRARQKSSSDVFSAMTLEGSTTEQVSPAQPAADAAAPVAVPQPRHKSSPSRGHPVLSRSAPLAIPAGRRVAGEERSHAFSDWDLPAAIDNDLAGDRTWQQRPNLNNGGPRTAPLTGPPLSPMFAYSPPPSPTTMRNAFKHHRSPSYPSEGMFSMSLDDDEELHKSDEGGARPRTPLRMKRRSGQPRGILYAGSSFQNTPNPNDLPPPSFLSTP